MKLLFVRHGLTDETTKGMKGAVGHDDSLNELGREQAEKAAEICAEFNPTIIYTSPFKRTKETAEIIGARRGAVVAIAEQLKEYFAGDWGKLSIEEGRQRFIDAGMWNYNDKKYDFCPPGGESWRDVHERTDEIIHKAIAQCATSDAVVFVTHNVAMKAMIGSLQGKPFKDWLPVLFHTGSVTAFEYEKDTFTELFVDRH